MFFCGPSSRTCHKSNRTVSTATTRRSALDKKFRFLGSTGKAMVFKLSVTKVQELERDNVDFHMEIIRSVAPFKGTGAYTRQPTINLNLEMRGSRARQIVRVGVRPAPVLYVQVHGLGDSRHHCAHCRRTRHQRHRATFIHEGYRVAQRQDHVHPLAGSRCLA